QGRISKLIQGKGELLAQLLPLFGTSQFLADVLIRYPEHLDELLAARRSNPTRDELLSQLQSDVESTRDDAGVLRAFRRFRQRQLLRIGILDVVHERPLEEVTADISRVADAALEVALSTAWQKQIDRRGVPYAADGRPARLAVFAFG